MPLQNVRNEDIGLQARLYTRGGGGEILVKCLYTAFVLHSQQSMAKCKHNLSVCNLILACMCGSV